MSINTTSGHISIGNNSDEYRMRQYIEQLERAVHERDEYIKQLSEIINTGIFDEKEISFLLMRCHPDKNPDSEIANTITAKLIHYKKNK